jgi:hypothetical protein
MIAKTIIVAIALLFSGTAATLAKSPHTRGHNPAANAVKGSGNQGANRWGWQGPPPWPSLNRVEDDPEGAYLLDVAAALSYAEYTIRGLRKKSGYNDLALMMIVTDQARQTVLFLPFFPGC